MTAGERGVRPSRSNWRTTSSSVAASPRVTDRPQHAVVPIQEPYADEPGDPFSWTPFGGGGVPMSRERGRKQRVYPPAFRQQVLELVWAGRTPEELSREFEPSAQTI